MRIRYHASLYDLVRFDHAKGLFFYGAMDPSRTGHDAILPGPGAPLLRHLVRYARRIGLTLFAEDAGDRLEELRACLLKLGVPGIRILRFAYNEKKKVIERDYADPANYREDAVAYTSTHDTETLMGYLALLTAKEKRHLCEHVRVQYADDAKLLAARLRGAVLASPARFSIVPIQDWLLTRDRINVPGTERPHGDRNWRYRLSLPVERLPKLHVSSRSERRASRSSGSGTGPKR
jgi:4-alpha-glucanotransferase